MKVKNEYRSEKSRASTFLVACRCTASQRGKRNEQKEKQERRERQRDSDKKGVGEGRREGRQKKQGGGQSVSHLHPVGGAVCVRSGKSGRCKVSLRSTSAASLSRALIRGEGFSRARGDALTVLECVCDLARTLNALLKPSRAGRFY